MIMADGKFQLGRISATQGAVDLMARLDPDGDHSRYAATLLARHHSGDWGDLDDEDKATNERALHSDLRLMSSYGEGDNRLWVITEWDRSRTTILRPDEY